MYESPADMNLRAKSKRDIDMTGWNVSLLYLIGVLLFLTTAAEYVEYLAAADALSVDLAPLLNVDVDLLRRHITTVLETGRTRHAIVRSGPLIVLLAVVSAKLLRDSRSSRKSITATE